MLERTDLAAGTANRLVSGIDDVDSAQIAHRQWRLGRIVADDADLGSLFDDGLDGLVDRLEGTALAEPLAAFLTDFGHRGNDEYELAVAVLGDGTPAGARRRRPNAARATEPSPPTTMSRLRR